MASTEHPQAPSAKQVRLTRLFAKYFSDDQAWRHEPDQLRVAVRIVDAVRKSAGRDPGTVSIAALLHLIASEKSYREGLAEYVRQLVNGKPFRSALTDPGILADADFRREVVRRISYKILPYQPEEGTLSHVLMNVFFTPGDARWVRAVPKDELLLLFRMLGFSPIHAERSPEGPYAELIFAAEVLAHRISGRALEEDVMKMVPEQEGLANPFLAFQRELDAFELRFFSKEAEGTVLALDHRQLLVLHAQCREYVERAFRNSSKFGISLRVNQNLLRIRQQLDRLELVLRLMVVDGEHTPEQNTVDLAVNLVLFNCERNNVRQLLDDSTRLLAFEITQHTGRTGEHYITEGPREYHRMFLSAAGGGVIVAVMCIAKVLLGNVHAPLFIKALLSSLNYAVGFITIYLLGATLATKQPAMTAATLVKALKSSVGDRSQYAAFADLFARVFRSQFIAFVGNVFLAFPVALLLVLGIQYLFHDVVGAGKWPTLIGDLDPVTSLSVFHAAIAGCFLFLSGIIAGSVANRGRHERIPLRIAEHPLLKQLIGVRRTARLARLYEKRWAGILSNLVFGLCMGSTFYIGQFFGLPLDIRHITFAAGNMAIGLHGAGMHLPLATIIWSVIGIGVIGLVNFAVSFALSLSLAMRSRSIPFRDLDDISRAVWEKFKRRPMQFFFPPRRQTTSVPDPLQPRGEQ